MKRLAGYTAFCLLLLAAFVLTARAGEARQAPAAQHPVTCTFDGGGAVTAGNAARTSDGTEWPCTDGGQLARMTPAASVTPARQLPGWVHWKNAGRVQDCGGGPAVIVWGGHGDSSALVCESGVAEGS